MTKEKLFRGDVYMANLNPRQGSEQGGKRPVIIIQNDTGNKYSPTVIIAAVTSSYHKKKNLPTHVTLESNCLKNKSQVLLEQIRTIDKCRLMDKLGSLNDKDMQLINDALIVSLALTGGQK